MNAPFTAYGSAGVSGSTCVITGANSGIGKAAATDLARMGARVVMVCRNRERGRQAMLEIIRDSGSSGVDLILGDLSLMRDVRAVASQLNDRYPQIDILINNAGGFRRKCRLTEEGLEETFALNHLAPFLLTNLLLYTLRNSAPARIINVSSEAHRRARIRFDDMRGCKGYRGMRVYGGAKLANLLFTDSLSHRLEGSGITVNAMHPGVVATNFAREGISAIGLFFRLFRPLLRSAEKGAQTIVYLATDPAAEGVSGAYFIDERQRAPSRHAVDRATAEKLWVESARLVDLPIK